jgi:ribosomal protein L11 methyltransferase
MDYTEVRFYNLPEQNEILIALIADAGFDMFEEREDGVNGYIPSANFNKYEIDDLLQSNPFISNIRYETSLIKDQNWNKEWEKNFEPVLIAGSVFIRAPFHPPSQYPVELIIEPKMSFGTGHHSTTALMIELMMGINMQNKKVLDMGCGSGVLAILAEKRGAEEVVAIDFDNWAFQNTLENVSRNHCERIEVKEGTAELINGLSFEIILANINRNVLLADMDKYFRSLSNGGVLLLSGILKEDEQLIRSGAKDLGLTHQQTVGHENWIAIQFKK